MPAQVHVLQSQLSQRNVQVGSRSLLVAYARTCHGNPCNNLCANTGLSNAVTLAAECGVLWHPSTAGSASRFAGRGELFGVASMSSSVQNTRDTLPLARSAHKNACTMLFTMWPFAHVHKGVFTRVCSQCALFVALSSRPAHVDIKTTTRTQGNLLSLSTVNQPTANDKQ